MVSTTVAPSRGATNSSAPESSRRRRTSTVAVRQPSVPCSSASNSSSTPARALGSTPTNPNTCVAILPHGYARAGSRSTPTAPSLRISQVLVTSATSSSVTSRLTHKNRLPALSRIERSSAAASSCSSGAMLYATKRASCTCDGSTKTELLRVDWASTRPRASTISPRSAPITIFTRFCSSALRSSAGPSIRWMYTSRPAPAVSSAAAIRNSGQTARNDMRFP